MFSTGSTASQSSSIFEQAVSSSDSGLDQVIEAVSKKTHEIPFVKYRLMFSLMTMILWELCSLFCQRTLLT